MYQKEKKWNDLKDQHSVLSSEEGSVHERPEKIGWLRKLLNWISNGAAKSKMDTTGCPT